MNWHTSPLPQNQFLFSLPQQPQPAAYNHPDLDPRIRNNASPHRINSELELYWYFYEAIVDAYNYAANNPLKNPRYNEKPFSRPLTFLLNAPPLPTDITHGDMVFITKVLSGHTSVRVTMERTEVFNTRHLWYTDHRDVIWKPLRLWPIEDIHEALNYARSLRIFAHILDDDDFDMYFALARRLGDHYHNGIMPADIRDSLRGATPLTGVDTTTSVRYFRTTPQDLQGYHCFDALASIFAGEERIRLVWSQEHPNRNIVFSRFPEIFPLDCKADVLRDLGTGQVALEYLVNGQWTRNGVA